MRLGTVKNQDHGASLSYLSDVRISGKFSHLPWPVKWHGPDEYDGLQLADLAMGMFSTAFRGQDEDRRCAAHLVRQKNLIRRSPEGGCLGWGIEVYGDSTVLTDRAWWPSL